MTHHIGIAHAHERNIGYGRLGADLMKALIDLGLEAYDWTEGWENHQEPVEAIWRPGRPRTVVFVSPGTHTRGWFEGQRPIAFTMWEATELPEANRETLHEYAQIIVPSRANLALYSRYHDNVKYVPLGVGPEWYYRPRDPLVYSEDRNAPTGPIRGGSNPRGVGVPTSTPSFRFMCAGTSPLRKGIDLTAAAFQLAFPQRELMSPRPELIYKTPLGIEVQGVTQHVPGYMSDEDELDLYAGIHCFVSLARGEGFGLQPLQAMAMGIPTILVNAHGHEAFAKYGIPVSAELVDAPEDMGFGEAGQWWQASIAEAAEQMRSVYNDYALHANQAEQRSNVIHNYFSWERTAIKLIHAIGEKWLTPFPAGGDTWHRLEPKKYLIRVTTPYVGNVNGVAYRFEPGRDYYDVADIKRQIARSGHLDPSAINDDGLVKADIRLSGSYAYCPCCQQRLNTQPTKTDDLLRERQ